MDWSVVNVLWVAAGAVPGALCRYYFSLWARQAWGTHFPWGTFLINISGAFLIGLVAMWPVPEMIPAGVKLMLLTGFFGAYTTFSTYALDTTNLVRTISQVQGLVYGLGTPVLGLIAGELGVLLGQRLF